MSVTFLELILFIGKRVCYSVSAKYWFEKKKKTNKQKTKQGRIHGNPVADGWAGAVMRKPLGIQK